MQLRDPRSFAATTKRFSSGSFAARLVSFVIPEPLVHRELFVILKEPFRSFDLEGPFLPLDRRREVAANQALLTV